MYKCVTEQGVWKIATDQKLRELCKTRDLVAGIKREHSECVGLVVRLDQTSMAEKILASK